jgi:ppGpp synthetase/RelA/SpoT-type nucleotidyltranferase
MQRTLTALLTEVNHVLLPAILELDGHEQIIVKGRVKESESAVESLRRRQQSRSFADDDETYTLTALPDLIGIRVLAFPQRRLQDARSILEAEPRLSGWKADHISGRDSTQPPIALKYHGTWRASDSFRSELQIVPLLIGLFWEVEHSALYKPAPQLLGLARSIEMQDRNNAVVAALQEFEREFDRIDGGDQ